MHSYTYGLGRGAQRENRIKAFERPFEFLKLQTQLPTMYKSVSRFADGCDGHFGGSVLCGSEWASSVGMRFDRLEWATRPPRLVPAKELSYGGGSLPCFVRFGFTRESG